MLIQKPGWIMERVLLLGSRAICMYLIKGKYYTLLGGGVVWDVPRLEAQLDQFKIERERIRHLVVSHAHHDHCGAVPYLLERYPHIQVSASSYCAELLCKPKPVQLMKNLNRQTLDAMRRPHHFNDISLTFRPVTVANPIQDGHSMDIGQGLVLQFFLTPGHSRCSLSVYIPRLKALFPADAMPFPQPNGNLIVTANHDFDDYLESLQKLQSLPVSLIGYEHGGALTGPQAETIISNSIAATKQERQRIIARYAELKDIERLVDEMAEKFLTLPLFRLVPFDTMRAIIRRMVSSAVGI